LKKKRKEKSIGHRNSRGGEGGKERREREKGKEQRDKSKMGGGISGKWRVQREDV